MLNIFQQDQQYVVQMADQTLVLDVLTYITNEIKKTSKSDYLSYTDGEGKSIQLHEIVETSQVFVALDQSPVERNSETRKQRQVYTSDGTTTKIKIEKYKNNRKTEQVLMDISTIRTLNKQYEDTYAKFLVKNTKNSEYVDELFQQTQSPPSPTFGKPVIGNNAKPTQLKQAGNDGISQLAFMKQAPTHKVDILPYTPAEVALHNTEDDAWTVVNGRIYDITYYLDRHPGGKEKLMLGVGNDCTALFNQFHPWVNCHYLLQKFQVGFLVRNK